MSDRSIGLRLSTLVFSGIIALTAGCGGTAEGAADSDPEGPIGASESGLPAPGDPSPPPSLKSVKVPEPSNLREFVRDKEMAIALGKALFWDMQIGSDGIQACASCHFHAGTDNRSRNQLSPGLLTRAPDLSPKPDRTFQVGGPNYQLKTRDFPFHKLANPDDRNSRVLSDSNDVVSSQGVTFSKFVDSEAGRDEDERTVVSDPDGFSIRGTNVRRAQERNTPSVIDAVFNFRNFWDGRAQNIFNGVNAYGDRDPNARVLKATRPNTVEEVRVRIDNSSLASQAMEPPNGVEMGAVGRTFADIGDKLGEPAREKKSGRGCHSSWEPRELVALRPLAKQQVAYDDSVLGPLSRYPWTGLQVRSYGEMIRKAFVPAFWDSDRLVRVDEKGRRTVLPPGRGDESKRGVYTLMEANFSLFFGLAIQAYEATLVSDDTPYDRYREGDQNALTPKQKQGLEIFLSQSRGRCINCHGGPEFTDASVTRWSKNQIRRREGNVLDFGFNNIGVRPTFEDLGNGGTDPFGNPLSVTRLALLGKFAEPTVSPALDPPNERQAADGAFKVPGLRNVELTAPYFHNGGTLTLRQVVDFYSRGGDFQPIVNRSGETISPLQTLNNTEEEKDALVAFLHALTDERVRYARAPFDHPQLYVPNWHRGGERSISRDRDGSARDEFLEISAVGRHGGVPTPNFLEGEP